MNSTALFYQYSFVNIGSFISTTFIAILPVTFGFRLLILYFFCAPSFYLQMPSGLFQPALFRQCGKSHLERPAPVRKQGQERSRRKQALDFRGQEAHCRHHSCDLVLRRFLDRLVYGIYARLLLLWLGKRREFLNHANWMIGFFHVPTSWFDSVNALTCIVLGPVFALLWARWLSARKETSACSKTAIGMILVGVAFVVMVCADIVRGDGQCSLLWIVLVSLLMSIGEMVFSPLRNSFITIWLRPKSWARFSGSGQLPYFFATLIYPKLYAYLKTVPSRSVMESWLPSSL